jgi:hypothetical protein
MVTSQLAQQQQYFEEEIKKSNDLYKLKPKCFTYIDNPTVAEKIPIELIGLDRFIMLVKIDHLSNYSQNHYMLVDPFYHDNAYKNILGLSGKIIYDQLNYDVYTLYKYRLFKIDMLLIPQNTQFVIFVNKNITVNDIKYFSGYILSYINLRMEVFAKVANTGLSTNVKYKDYYFDPLDLID